MDCHNLTGFVYNKFRCGKNEGKFIDKRKNRNFEGKVEIAPY